MGTTVQAGAKQPENRTIYHDLVNTPGRLVPLLVAMVLAVGVVAPSGAMGQGLEVRLTQTGIAGDTGQGWRVEPNGVWAAFRIENGTAGSAYAQGTLKPEDMAKLEDTLNQNNFVALPDRLGSYVSANPETLTIRAGPRVKVLKVPGGTNLVGSANQKADLDPAGQRAVAIANMVRTLTTTQP